MSEHVVFFHETPVIDRQCFSYKNVGIRRYFFEETLVFAVFFQEIAAKFKFYKTPLLCKKFRTEIYQGGANFFQEGNERK